MASAVAGTAAIQDLQISFLDTANEPAIVTIPLDGAMADADIATIVDDYAALSNALITKAVVIRRFAITGFAVAGKPAATAIPLVAAVLAMEFDAPNPRNAAKSVSKQVTLPAYIDAIRNDVVVPHIPVTNNATLNGLVALLQTGLVRVDPITDAITSAGEFVFNPGSKFGTKLSVTDGK